MLSTPGLAGAACGGPGVARLFCGFYWELAFGICAIHIGSSTARSATARRRALFGPPLCVEGDIRCVAHWANGQLWDPALASPVGAEHPQVRGCPLCRGACTRGTDARAAHVNEAAAQLRSHRSSTPNRLLRAQQPTVSLVPAPPGTASEAAPPATAPKKGNPRILKDSWAPRARRRTRESRPHRCGGRGGVRRNVCGRPAIARATSPHSTTPVDMT